MSFSLYDLSVFFKYFFFSFFFLLNYDCLYRPEKKAKLEKKKKDDKPIESTEFVKEEKWPEETFT